MMSKKSVQNYVLPLLKYAHERDVRTQINSNLTLEPERYLLIAPYLDVLHISHNWGTIDEFIETGFAMMERKPTYEQRAALFKRMIDNSKMLAEHGVMVSAETMLNKKTLPYLEHIHNQIINEMKCARHEVHPMSHQTSLNCHCPAVKCLGSNVLVKNMYYQDQSFVSGSARV